ncbi:MAG: APC family permease [Rhodospirillales bacterium]|nr:APC family permease [Rhodospirillales bacterium]
MAMADRKHTVWSGGGLVVANMVGVGVFLSTGFMAQDMAAGPILIAWVVGSAIALCGVLAYGGILTVINESGGEYRLLSDLMHPFVGYLSGWGSLILGFSAAIAIDAHAIGSFLNTLVDGPDPRLTGAAVIVALTFLHIRSTHLSHRGQNLLVAVKLAVLGGLVALGLAVGSNRWPEWSPPGATAGFPWLALIENQFWIAFAFSGWNAAVYTAREFRRPDRDVARAMLLGLAVVAPLYLLINWVFVANLTPDQAAGVFLYEEKRITLGHLVASGLFGQFGGQTISIFVIWAFLSAISAMMMVGPRVYTAMAADRLLPAVFASKQRGQPVAATVLQAATALLILFSQSLRETVQAASGFLMIFSALTALAIFQLRRRRPAAAPVGWLPRVAAVAYAAAVACILVVGLSASPTLVWSLGAVLLLSLIGYFGSKKARKQAPAAATVSRETEPGS